MQSFINGGNEREGQNQRIPVHLCVRPVDSRQSCSSESSTQSDVPSQCQSPGMQRPVPQRYWPSSHPARPQQQHTAIRTTGDRTAFRSHPPTHTL